MTLVRIFCTNKSLNMHLTLSYNSDTFEFRDYKNINYTDLEVEYNNCDWTPLYICLPIQTIN